jgi:hypothetical protein
LVVEIGATSWPCLEGARGLLEDRRVLKGLEHPLIELPLVRISFLRVLEPQFKEFYLLLVDSYLLDVLLFFSTHLYKV